MNLQNPELLEQYCSPSAEEMKEIRDNILLFLKKLPKVSLPHKPESLFLDVDICAGYIAEFFSQKMNIDKRNIMYALESQTKPILNQLYEIVKYHSVRAGFISVIVNFRTSESTKLAKKSYLGIAEAIHMSVGQELEANLINNFGNQDLKTPVNHRNDIDLKEERSSSKGSRGGKILNDDLPNFGLIGELEQVIGLENATAIIRDLAYPSNTSIYKLKAKINTELANLDNNDKITALAQKLGLKERNELVKFLLTNIEESYIDNLDENQKLLVKKIKVLLLDQIITKQAIRINESILVSDIDKHSTDCEKLSLDEIVVVLKQKMSERKFSFSDAVNIICEQLKISQDNREIRLRKELLSIVVVLFATNNEGLSGLQMSIISEVWEAKTNSKIN